MIWLLFAGALLALAAGPFLWERRRAQMTDDRRGSAPGHLVELSQGVTHYRLSGPPSGPLVICVHGLTTPSFVWGALTRGLTAAGFRVLVYDLYGRGYSDRPGGLQDKGFFLQQLDDLLDHLEIDQPFDLIGYSMGGAIATAFAAEQTARITRLILLAPAGMTVRQGRVVRMIREHKRLGDWLMLLRYPSVLRSGLRAEAALPTAVPEIARQQADQLTYQGFVPAVLSSLRGILSKPQEEEHLTLRRAGLPILAIWGGEDNVIPARAMGQLAAWNHGVVHEVIEHAGHGLPYTHSDRVLSLITAFLPTPETDDRGR